MGTIYQPICSNCNHNYKMIMVGVGMMGPEPDIVPAACYHCNRLSKKDINEDPMQCSRCKRPVTPLKGFGNDEEPNYEEKYKCPKCGEQSLEMVFSGFWD